MRIAVRIESSSVVLPQDVVALAAHVEIACRHPLALALAV
jgi:hypothetical protein